MPFGLRGGRAWTGLLTVVAVVALAGPASAGPRGSAKSQTPAGYDVSYPQCGSSLPSAALFGIVGVNDGIVFKANPCLSAELSWAEQANNHAPALYANTADPGPAYSSHWPTGQQSPQLCDGTDSLACNYDYGWNAAADSFADAVTALGATSAAAAPWWFDVETGNSWQTLESGNTTSAQQADTAALHGAVDSLINRGVATIGFYSTGYQWAQITGGTTDFASRPSWVAGFRSLSAAQSGCAGSGFTGGRIALTQYPKSGFDADYAC